MKLTVEELANAVEKSEGFVRQHIHRGHLPVHRKGRKVTVAYEEAVHWARERGLQLALPHQTALAARNVKERTARMMVLAWHRKDVPPINLFTHMRHRRTESLGPWTGNPDGIWSCQKILTGAARESEEFCLYSIDAAFEHCQELVEQILKEGTLKVNDLEIYYALEHSPRQYFAPRDQRGNAEPSFASPFSRYSAEITEYWSFAEEPRVRWSELAESQTVYGVSLEERMGFPIERRSDRVGNLLITGAEDEIECDLIASYNNTLVLSVWGDTFQPAAYTAAVWASHSGDNVLRRSVAVTQGETVISLSSAVDHIGFALYRNIDGRCIDLMDQYLIMELSLKQNILMGPTMEMHDLKSQTRHQVSQGSTRSKIDIKLDSFGDVLDRKIRQAVLANRMHQREAVARREDKMARFEPDQFEEAVDYFLLLLSQFSYRDGPIYLADPYFMTPDPRVLKTGLYLKMLAVAAGRSLRILCGGNQNNQTWWSNYPANLTCHFKVRSFRTKIDSPAFHDRYLITPEKEILITHSLNGWSSGGVTFASAPYDVYRTAAEKLWSLAIGTTDSYVDVEEVC